MNLVETAQKNAHRTAIKRNRLAAPLAWLQSQGWFVRAGRGLDYGCGRGEDAGRLGFERFDPHWFPAQPEGRFDTIVCSYVLNVVPASVEASILESIRALLRRGGRAFITVRRDVKRDGLTHAGTYQRDVILALPVLRETSGYCIYEMRVR